MPPKLPKYLFYFFIFLVAVIWISLFKDFLTGLVAVNIDTFTTYSLFKYFFNNLFNGVVPLWEPYTYLGRPHIHLAFVGVLNILVLPIYLLHFVGVNYYDLYVIYLVSYLVLGTVGFYHLSKLVLKNDSYALIGVCLFVFSGFSSMIFNQIFILMLFAPVVWFFVFFLKFFSDFKRRDFWGMVCSLMVLAVSYYPFYFICLISSFLIFYIMLFRHEFLKNVSSFLFFVKSHKVMTFLGLLFVLAAFIPLFLFTMTNSSGEIISPSRHNCKIADQCPKKVDMTYDEVASGGTFGERFAGGTLFSHLDKFNYNNDCLLYVPTFGFIVLLMAALTVMDRKRLIILCTWCAIFVLSLGSATPVYKFLFDHVFFFKYFRNLFFYSAFLIPLFILFAVAQLKSVVEQIQNVKLRWVSVVLIVAGHGVFYGVLNYQGSVIGVTYGTVLLSLLFFVALALGVFHNRLWLMLLFLLATIIVEPVQVFTHYRNTATPYSYQLPQEHEQTVFKYQRPSQDLPTQFGKTFYAMFFHLAQFRDTAGTVEFMPDFVNSHVFDYYSQVSADQQKSDVQNKITIYSYSPNKEGLVDSPLELTGDSADFKVLHFDVNSLKVATNFSVPRFLVYRDAYSVYWKAFLNGKADKIQLVDVAFKGIAIPAGENVIELRYMPPGGQGIYIFVLALMAIAFCLLGVFYFKPKYAGG
jgi:hypothetical protein